MSEKFQLEEIPYKHSPKLEWVGQMTVLPAVGSFTFTDTVAQNFSPIIKLRPRALYFIDDMDFRVNAAQTDYDGAVTQNMKLVLQESAGGIPALLYPFEMPSFLQKAPVRQYFFPQIEPNYLQFRLAGVVSQTMALAGLASMKATIIIRAYEITQPLAIEAILRGYDDARKAPPPSPLGSRVPRGSEPSVPLVPGLQFRG